MNEFTMFSDEMKPAGDAVAIYARVALDEGNELKEQADMLIKNAESVGDDVYSVYYECESGLKQNRTEFMRLMADIKDNKFKRLYIRDISRLTRNYLLISDILKDIQNHNVEIVVCINGRKYKI